MSEYISQNVVILTRAELREREDAAFQRGVERGKFEAQSAASRDKLPIAQNCRYWSGGYCQRCGAQHQSCQVGADFRCPHFERRPLGESGHPNVARWIAEGP